MSIFCCLHNQMNRRGGECRGGKGEKGGGEKADGFQADIAACLEH